MKRLSDNILLLGNTNFNYYLAGQKEAVIIECGMTAGVSLLAEQWASLPQKPEVKYILAMHSHFDHVCGIAMLKTLFPSALAVGSARTQKILTSDKVKQALKRADDIVTAAYIKNGLLKEKPADLNIELLGIDLCVGDGDSLNLGNDLKIDIFETPGHSPCSISAYFEQDKAMFLSDAAGYRDDSGLMSPVFFQDYELYINSIKRIMDIPTEILGVGHGKVCTGKEVQEYYKDGLLAAQEAFAEIKSKLEKGISEEAVTTELFAKYITGALAYYPEDMMLGSMYQLVKSVKNCLT